MSRAMRQAILLIIITIARTLVARTQVGSSESLLNFGSLNITNNNETNVSWIPQFDDSSVFGDIIPDTLSRNVGRLDIRLWPNGLVYFKITDEFDDKQKKYIYRAMIGICRISCVCFMPAGNDTKTYLQIKATEKGCGASIGYREGVRYLYLALDEIDTNCFTLGTLTHELLHVVGFIHEHNVPNRDKYVKIIYDNIDKKLWPMFEKWSTYDLPYDNFPYDFSSIMHYPLDKYSMNGERTIRPIVDPGNVQIGHETMLSQLDIQKLNAIYKCTCTH